MFQIITGWNLTRPESELSELVENIQLRGYNIETYLTGEFARGIAEKSINPLSVSNIVSNMCPTNRDLYYQKGRNRPGSRGLTKDTWNSKAGVIVEQYIESLFNDSEGCNPCRYNSVISIGEDIHDSFTCENQRIFKNLRKLETLAGNMGGNTDWLEQILSNSGRIEIGKKILHSCLDEETSLNPDNVKFKEKINPVTREIGINKGAEPDFIIPEFSIVGDIKTGYDFKEYYLYTCTGYALAYENEHKNECKINWGIIYFIPTYMPGEYFKPYTFPRIYIFPINDQLRSLFIEKRNMAYNIISREEPPRFPVLDDKQKESCSHCKYYNYCITQGLDVTNVE